jgi:prepilin-type N-terminal cleavage/methylation domain-containing protein
LKTRARDEGGFTLMEVLISIAIIAVVTVVLLGRRVEILRDTQRAKDQRLAWALAAQKMTDIELDPYLFRGESDSRSGDFSEAGTEYAGFLWRYDAAKEDVPTNETRQDPPKQIFRVRLSIQKAGEEGDLVTLEAMYPIQEATGR